METGINGLTAIGYGLDDYISMFDLTPEELDMNILDFRSGACSFAADMANNNKSVVACDKVYLLPLEKIKALTEQAQEALKADLRQHGERYTLSPAQTDAFLKARTDNIRSFYRDLPKGLKEGRYTTDAFPKLSFRDEQFNLALCCHFLFTFSDQLDADFHVRAIQELARVANEVRIFPLVTRQGGVSPWVGQVIAELQAKGLSVELRGVPFEFQKEGNAMLRVWTDSCSVKKHQK